MGHHRKSRTTGYWKFPGTEFFLDYLEFEKVRIVFDVVVTVESTVEWFVVVVENVGPFVGEPT